MEDRTTRRSILAPFIDGLLAEKHANGYTYKSEELVLNRFDSYCADNGLDTLEISQNFLSGWMERRETEGEFNRAPVYGIMRNQGIYPA